MKSVCRAAALEPSSPLTVSDRHAAAAFAGLLDGKPLLEPLRPACYGPWLRPLHAVAVAYAHGGQAAAVGKFEQLSRRHRGLGRLLRRCIEDVDNTPAPKRTMGDLLGAPAPSCSEVVPGLVPAGLSVLAGRPRAGKSWLSLQLALAVASGSQVIDLQSDVLFLALEDPPGRLQRRLRQLAAPAHLPLHFATAWPALDRGGLAPLAQQLVHGHRFVVIDTFTAAVSIACLAYPARILDVLARLHVLAAAFDAAVLLVDRHHLEGCHDDAIDAAFAAATQRGLFAKTLTLARPFGQHRATLALSDFARPIILAQHPELKHETLGTRA